MRRVLQLCLFLGLALGAEATQDKDLTNPKKWPVVLKGEHYQIWSTATPKEAEEMLRFMELVFTTYTQLLDLPRPPAQKMVIILYRDRAEYVAGGAPGGSAAYYNGSRLVGYLGDPATN